MKKLVVMLSLVFGSSLTLAQPNPASVSPEPSSTGTLPSHQALATAERFNPFTGQSLTIEIQQLEVEKAKLHTQLLEELLRASTLKEDLTNLPIKKRAEVLSQLGGDAGKNLASLLPPGYAGYAPKEEKKEVVVQAPVRTKAKPVIVAPPASFVPVVSSIITYGSSKSVVLEANNQVVIAKQGDSTPFGTVTEITADGATVGGNRIRQVKAVASRVTLTEPMASASEPVSFSTGKTAEMPKLPSLPPIPGADKPSASAPKLTLVSPSVVVKE